MGALIGAALFVRLLLALQLAGGPLPDLHALWGETDNAFFHAWGQRIAAGDLLQREPWHPMAAWMTVVARAALERSPALAESLRAAGAPDDPSALERRCWDRWLGGPTYFQEPGYPHLIGLTYRALGADPWWVFGWQALLGVVGVLLVHRLAVRLHSHAAGAAAGALAILAPVPLFYEFTLLRDSLVVALTLALALLMAWAVEGPRRRWLVLGVAFGAAATVKQTFLAMPLLLAAWRLVTVRATGRDRLAAASLTLAGLGLAILPWAARNLMVGAPALALNGSAASQLPMFHTADATPFLPSVDLAYVRILLSSEGSALAGLLEAARSHRAPWSLLMLEGSKVAYAWHGYEAPNNVDFYLFRQAAPLLAALPVRFVLLVPFAAVGLARLGARAWPLVIPAIASLGGIVLAGVLARYRAPLLALLLPLAGVGVLEVVGWARGRRLGLLLGWVLAAGAYAAWATSAPPHLSDGERAAAYRRGAEAFAQASPSLAALHLQEALRLEPGAPGGTRRLAQLLLGAGDPQAALSALDAGGAATAPPDRVLRATILAELGRTGEAVAEVRAAVAAAPEVPGGQALLERLDPRAASGGPPREGAPQ